MKKYINIALTALVLVMAGACSKETPFDEEMPGAMGHVRTGGLTVTLENNNGPRSLKNSDIRQAAPSIKDFTVEFIKKGETVPAEVYKYSEMPEIVTLPVGNYIAKAYYGENPSAAWEAPYYQGESDAFEIIADDIIDVDDPIVCSLSNVRVSVNFDSALRSAMSADSKVTVKVGESGTLDFTPADTERSGYFAFVEDSHTLVATFNGEVEGYQTSETKSYTNVEPGMHYQITFRLHDAGEEDPGMIDGDDIIVVDAEVIGEDMNHELEPGEVILPDDMRPQEGQEPGTDNPEPDQPVDPSKPVPTIVARAPYDIDKVNELQDDEPVVVTVTSYADGGITGFTVKIISNTLTPEDLEGVNLTDFLDLVTPGEYEEALDGLGLPYNVGGEKEVKFEVTTLFISLLKALGEGNHNFVLTVSDANGTTVKTLKLHNN